ncbi:unnamed protein product [Agarophyton chilense]
MDKSETSSEQPSVPVALKHNVMLTIKEYNTELREQVWCLFENGMKQNSEEAAENLTRSRIATLLDFSRPQFQNMDEFLCANNGGKLFVALDNHERVVGMIGVKRTDKDILTNSAELTRISVAREWRRKAMETYAKLGFKETGSENVFPMDSSPRLVQFVRYMSKT